MRQAPLEEFRAYEAWQFQGGDPRWKQVSGERKAMAR